VLGGNVRGCKSPDISSKLSNQGNITMTLFLFSTKPGVGTVLISLGATKGVLEKNQTRRRKNTRLRLDGIDLREGVEAGGVWLDAVSNGGGRTLRRAAGGNAAKGNKATCSEKEGAPSKNGVTSS